MTIYNVTIDDHGAVSYQDELTYKELKKTVWEYLTDADRIQFEKDIASGKKELFVYDTSGGSVEVDVI